MLRTFRGADGIKTGFHNKAGFCVTASATRGDLHIITVVLGAPTRQDCFRVAAQFMNQGFTNYRVLVPVKQGKPVERQAPVSGGVVETVPLMATSDVRVLIKRGEEKKVQIEINVPDTVSAPVKVGQVVGEIVVKFDGAAVGKTSAAAAQEVAQASLWRRWWPF